MSTHSHPPGSIGNWNIGTFKARLRKHVGQSSLSVTGYVSASGDVYALGSISGSNNLAVGGNIHASGTITCDTLNVNEINSTSETINTLEIVDKVILAASGTYPNNATGAGLQIGGHSTGSAGTDIAATFFYNSTKNSMDLSTTLSSSGDVYALGSISGSNNLALGGNAEISGNVKVGEDLYTDQIRRLSSNSTNVKINLNASEQKFYVGHASNEIVKINSSGISSSVDVYALGSISGSNNLAIGGNAEITGSIAASGSIVAQGAISANGFGNSQVILTPTVIPSEYNCLLYGPVTLRDEGTLQIEADSVVIVRSFMDFTGSL